MLSISIKLLKDNDNYEISNAEWVIEKPRRHWKLSNHCRNVLLPKFLPNPSLLTDELRLYWQLYSSRGSYEKSSKKDLDRMLRSSILKGLVHRNIKLSHILISEQLINLDSFDLLTRKSFVCKIVKFIRKQSSLQSFGIEGLKLERNEAYELLKALSATNKCVKYLYLWRVFDKREDIILRELNGIHIQDTIYRYCWLEPITTFRHLEILALNYDYVATETGNVLIFLARHLGRSWKLLQLLCLDGETVSRKIVPDTTGIPDGAWNEARKWSPKLKVQLILNGISDYDRHKTFLSQSIPMQALVLSTNLELLKHEQCFIDCTLKTIYLWYHRHLAQLYLNLWNVRECLDNHLRKIFPCLPNLKVFEFVGRIDNPITICTMCCQIKHGVCATRKVNLLLQRLSYSKKKEDDWLSKVHCFLIYFEEDFAEMKVEFNVRTYPI